VAAGLLSSLPLLQLEPAALSALFGGLAAIERKGALQLMLSRPLVLAPLLGWALGDARSGLMLGVPLELLFLGGVNLGGSIPENETLLAGALTAALVPAGLIDGRGVDPALAGLGSRCSIPSRWRAAGSSAQPSCAMARCSRRSSPASGAAMPTRSS
jgi:hypothetical protein